MTITNTKKDDKATSKPQEEALKLQAKTITKLKSCLKTKREDKPHLQVQFPTLYNKRKGKPALEIQIEQVHATPLVSHTPGASPGMKYMAELMSKM
jgi:hypothetical protein